MPRTSYFEWDRILLVKLVALTEMTVSSIYFLLYSYLCVLQTWSSNPENRRCIFAYKWAILVATLVDFALGSLLAYSPGLEKEKRRSNLIIWIACDTMLVPVNLFLLTSITWELGKTTVRFLADVHILRLAFVHLVYTVLHLFFIATVINFMAYYVPVLKQYDPFVRPHSVFEPTDPIITTTESRHIRFSESFLTTTRSYRSERRSEASGSPYQLQHSPTVSMRRGFYRIRTIPLITVFWCNKLSSWLLRPGREASEETSMWELLTEIQLTNPSFVNVLESAWKIRKWINFRQLGRIEC